MNMHILVVDDDENTRKVLRRFLASEGHVADACENGTKALEHLHADHYDVLLTDLVMPGMSGVELVDAAKEFCPTLRCLIMSGQARVWSTANEVAWVAKPIDIDRLLSALAS